MEFDGWIARWQRIAFAILVNDQHLAAVCTVAAFHRSTILSRAQFSALTLLANAAMMR